MCLCELLFCLHEEFTPASVLSEAWRLSSCNVWLPHAAFFLPAWRRAPTLAGFHALKRSPPWMRACMWRGDSDGRHLKERTPWLVTHPSRASCSASLPKEKKTKKEKKRVSLKAEEWLTFHITPFLLIILSLWGVPSPSYRPLLTFNHFKFNRNSRRCLKNTCVCRDLLASVNVSGNTDCDIQAWKQFGAKGELDSNFSETSRSNLKQATKSPSHSPSPPLSLHIGLFLRITVLFVGSCVAISSEWKNGIPLLLSVWLQRRCSAP